MGLKKVHMLENFFSIYQLLFFRPVQENAKSFNHVSSACNSNQDLIMKNMMSMEFLFVTNVNSRRLKSKRPKSSSLRMKDSVLSLMMMTVGPLLSMATTISLENCRSGFKLPKNAQLWLISWVLFWELLEPLLPSVWHSFWCGRSSPPFMIEENLQDLKKNACWLNGIR